MDTTVVDFSTLEELSGGDPKYKTDVMGIFLETMDTGLANLKNLVPAAADYEAIFRQAHQLKSSAGIVKIKDIHAQLAEIERLGRQISETGTEEGKTEIADLFSKVVDAYDEGRKVIIQEKDKLSA